MKKILIYLLVSTSCLAMEQQPLRKRKLAELLNTRAKKKVSFAERLEQQVPAAPEDQWEEARREARESYKFTAADGLNQLKELLEFWLDRVDMDQAVGQQVASEAGFAIYDQRALVTNLKKVLQKNDTSFRLQFEFNKFGEFLKALDPLINSYNAIEESESEEDSDQMESFVTKTLIENLVAAKDFVDKYIQALEAQREDVK